jgi:uncharacterized membrane protein YgdD (TMEM256/DUF423 family)
MRPALALGFMLAALSVALGAFGAHALKSSLSPERLVVWETAVRYQMYAGLGLQLGALHRPGSVLPLGLLGLGSVIFSGSLYLLCLTGQGWLGAITPLGGLALIAGWLLLAWEALQRD